MSNTFDRGQAPESSAPEKMLDKIRKLLAKASAEGCTQAERDMLNAKANELCAKYGIERARAAAAAGGVGDLALSPYCFYDESHYEQALLMYRVAEAVGCKSIFSREQADPDYDSTGLVVIGTLADAERAEVLFESLYLQMVQAATRVTRNARKSFSDGWSDTVAGRIQDAEGKARADEAPEGSSTALVLQSREVAVRDAFAKEFPHVSKSRALSRNVNGYAAGAAAGKQANIGGTRIGGQRAALAG